jgi:hypothetical protein
MAKRKAISWTQIIIWIISLLVVLSMAIGFIFSVLPEPTPPPKVRPTLIEVTLEPSPTPAVLTPEASPTGAAVSPEASPTSGAVSPAPRPTPTPEAIVPVPNPIPRPGSTP